MAHLQHIFLIPIAEVFCVSVDVFVLSMVYVIMDRYEIVTNYVKNFFKNIFLNK